MSRRPHAPTEKTRGMAQACTAFGVPEESTALLIGVDVKTLRKYYRDDIRRGRAKAHYKVGKTLFERATSAGPQSLAAAIYYSKAQMGWREVMRVEQSGVDGKPIEHKHSGEIDNNVAADVAMRTYLEVMDDGKSEPPNARRQRRRK